MKSFLAGTPFLWIFTALAIACAISACGGNEPTPSGQSAANAPIFSSISPDDLGAAARSTLALQESIGETFLRVRYASVNTASIKTGATLTFDFFDDASFNVTIERHETGLSGSDIWIGSVVSTAAEDSPGQLIIVNRAGVTVGTLWAPDGSVFEIGYLGENAHALREIDATRDIDCGCGADNPIALESAEGQQALTSRFGSARSNAMVGGGGNPDIDVMVIYTPEGRDQVGGETAITSLIEQTVVGANVAFANTALPCRYRLVYSGLVNPSDPCPQTGDNGTLLNWVTSNITVDWRRSACGADLVSLWYSSQYFQGLAWKPGAHSTCSVASVASALVFAHETGHNLRCDHTDYRYTGTSGTTWRGIMRTETNGDSLATVFNSPGVLWDGVASGTTNNANSKAQIESQMNIAANYKQPTDPQLTTITLSPSSASLYNNQTRQFSAQGSDQFGAPFPATFTWAATGGTVDANGLYTAPNNAGSYTVTATSGVKSGSASVSVTMAPTVLTSIEIQSGSLSIATNGTAQLQAVTLDQYGAPYSVSVNWSASGGSVTSGGLYTAPASAGNYTVTATAQGMSDSIAVTVQVPAPASVQLSLTDLPLVPDATWQFSATVRDQFGGPISAAVTWSASQGSVSGTGYFTAPSANGLYNVTITATSGNLAANATVRVQDLDNVMRADANGDGAFNILDLTYIVNYKFRNGPPCALLKQGDYNNDGSIDILDLTAMVNYRFRNGPPPPP